MAGPQASNSPALSDSMGRVPPSVPQPASSHRAPPPSFLLDGRDDTTSMGSAGTPSNQRKYVLRMGIVDAINSNER